MSLVVKAKLNKEESNCSYLCSIKSLYLTLENFEMKEYFKILKKIKKSPESS